MRRIWPRCSRRLSIAESVVGDNPRIDASSVGVTPGTLASELVTANSDAEMSLPSTTSSITVPTSCETTNGWSISPGAKRPVT